MSHKIIVSIILIILAYLRSFGQDQFILGSQSYFNNNYSKCIKHYSEFIKENPTSFSAYYNRGICYFYLHKYHDAIIDFQSVIELAPENSFEIKEYSKNFILECQTNKKFAIEKSTTNNEKPASENSKIKKAQQKPPHLELVEGTLLVDDNNHNNCIDAGERASIKFIITNSGQGDGIDLVAKIGLVQGDSRGLNFTPPISLGKISPGANKSIEVPIRGNMSLLTGTAIFTIKIDEANGFGLDPIQIEVNTKEFINPQVLITDYKLTSENSKTLVRKKPFDLQVIIQNIGQGVAEDVTVDLTIPKNVICFSRNEFTTIGTLSPNESKVLTYSLIVNELYNVETVPISFKIIEKYGKYSENKELSFNLHQKVDPLRLVVEEKQNSGKNVEITIATLNSSVDQNIPNFPSKNPHRFAIIIGNEDYSSRQNGISSESNVIFARNDAYVFGEYLKRTLGFEDQNVYCLIDATAGEMQQTIDLVTKLIKKIGPEVEFLFYYAGHGLPDEANRIPYLIPVDVSATNLNAAIKLSDLYKKFSEAGAKRITIILDACFSGGVRGEELLATRSVKIKPINEELAGNMVVFSATKEDQSALSYKNEKHGLFTFFLLKKIQETAGNITYGELADYLKKTVSIESLKVNQKEQDPVVNVSEEVKAIWEGWRLK